MAEIVLICKVFFVCSYTRVQNHDFNCGKDMGLLMPLMLFIPVIGEHQVIQTIVRILPVGVLEDTATHMVLNIFSPPQILLQDNNKVWKVPDLSCCSHLGTPICAGGIFYRAAGMWVNSARAVSKQHSTVELLGNC